MSDKGFLVTVEDLETGETQSRTVQVGDYMVIPFAPCEISSVNRYANGTVQVTLRNHRPASPSTRKG